MLLSPHFSYREMTYSPIAVRLNIPNIPNNDQIRNLVFLCTWVLEPLRAIIGFPVHINSGFRSYDLNRAIGGAGFIDDNGYYHATSQHCKGQAADIEVRDIPPQMIMQSILNSSIPFDQAILEFGEWTHLSWSNKPRRQSLEATKNIDGFTQYRPYP